MKINFNQTLNNITGEVLKEGDKEITLKPIIINALMGSYEDEKTLSGEDKLARYELATKINQTEEAEITVEEASQIKKLVGKAYSTLIVGQVYKILEGNS